MVSGETLSMLAETDGVKFIADNYDKIIDANLSVAKSEGVNRFLIFHSFVRNFSSIAEINLQRKHCWQFGFGVVWQFNFRI